MIVIVLIFKKGNINDVENYRGITLLSTLGKLFTRIINNTLTFWSDTFNIIGDTQSCFRKSRSTVDNVFMLQSVIDSCLNTKRCLHVAFINFKKAFDHVNRDCLWYKLLKSGIRGPIFNIIKDMYCNTASQVKHSGVFSNNFECNLGVRQGESLSPFLFTLFLYDIGAALESGGFRGVSMSDITIRTLLYADDLLLISDLTEDLQLGIDILFDYCTRWKLNINIEKSTVVIFRKDGSLSINDQFFFVCYTLLTVTNTYSYLGMLLSDRGKFDAIQKNIANCSRAY